MKKNIGYLAVLLLFSAACGFPGTAPAAPTTLPLPPTPDLQQMPVDEPAPTAASTADPLIFRDDFEGALADGWQWQSENAGQWSLERSPGWLEITAGSGFVRDGSLENLLLRPLPASDFEMETRLIFKPTANFQFSGLIAYESDADFIQFGRAFCSSPQDCANDGLYLDVRVQGSYTDDNFAIPAPGVDTLFLRLRREGDTFTSYYSEDGSNWVLVGVYSGAMIPSSIGLLAGQSTSGSLPAQFDYFSTAPLP
jgi:beta-xylosidase